MKPLRVTLVNKSDFTGGAAMVSYRLLGALRDAGVDARMLVAEKLHDSPFVMRAASPTRIRRPFLLERLRIFRALGYKRENLFKIDTADTGLPLWRHPWVRDADVVCLNWVNQGLLSLQGVRKIAAMGKPIVWTMHDMWCMTGVCHHAGTCPRFTAGCGDCPLLGSRASEHDISYKVHAEKAAMNARSDIRYVAVSRWLEQKARESSLLHDASLTVIPNAFPLDPSQPAPRHAPDGNITIIMGAARLDDPIKGLPLLLRATELLRDTGLPFRLVTYGTAKDPHALDGVAIPHRHLGMITSAEHLREVYRNGDIVVSSSHYETLPGTLVEGQAYGCVPVSFDRGGQADIVDHLETGYIARFSDDADTAARNLADGIVWAARHLSPEIVAAMRRSVIDRFSATSVAERYIALFRSII